MKKKEEIQNLLVKLPVSFVVNKGNNGVLAVRATTGQRIEDASDVNYAGAVDNSFLVYNSSTGVWEDESVGIFKTIAVAGQSDVVADAYNDTLTFAAGTGILLTTNATTDTLTITNTSAFSIPVFSAYSSAGETLSASGSSYDLRLDTQTLIDASTYSHSTSSNPEEITINASGVYEISYSGVLFNSNANSTAAAVVNFEIYKNGSVFLDPLNTTQNVAHLNTSNYNYINQVSNSYIVEFNDGDIIKLVLTVNYQCGGSPSPAVVFGYQGSAKNNVTIKKIGQYICINN